jgi:hypothetical protein
LPTFRDSKPRNALTAYRRHSKTHCKKTTPTKDPMNDPVAIAADDCKCSIVCSGRLALEEKPIRHLPLEANDWETARVNLAILIRDQRIEKLRVPTGQAAGPITVLYAAERFLTSKEPKDTPTYEKYDVLINGRLLPFCRNRRPPVAYIKAFESKDLVLEFIQSWRCLDSPGDWLGFRTEAVEITRLSCFLDYCRDGDGWITKNPAKTKILGKRYKETDADREKMNHGFELHEYEQVLNAFNYYPKPKWVGKDHLTPDRIYAATELERWCGLRSSDVTKFNSRELIDDGHGGKNAWYIQEKTNFYIGEPCPVPLHVVKLLEQLPPLYVSPDRKKYWFCTERGLMTKNSRRAATRLIEDKIQTLFALAQDPKLGGKPFTYPNLTPHCLRDTFAIQHLIAGRDIFQISAWLGHRDVKITQKAYLRTIQALAQKYQREGRDSHAIQLAQVALLRQASQAVSPRVAL